MMQPTMKYGTPSRYRGLPPILQTDVESTVPGSWRPTAVTAEKATLILNTVISPTSGTSAMVLPWDVIRPVLRNSHLNFWDCCSFMEVRFGEGRSFEELEKTFFRSGAVRAFWMEKLSLVHPRLHKLFLKERADLKSHCGIDSPYDMLKHRASLKDNFLKIFHKVVQPASVHEFLQKGKDSHSVFLSRFLDSSPDDIRFPYDSGRNQFRRKIPQIKVRISGVDQVGKSCILQFVPPASEVYYDNGVSLSECMVSLARTFILTELQLQKISPVGDCDMFFMHRKIQLHFEMILELWENLAAEMINDADLNGNKKGLSRTPLWVLRKLKDIIPHLREDEHGALEEDWIEDLVNDEFYCEEFPAELYYPFASLTSIPNLDWVLPIGSIVKFRKERLMPGDEPELTSAFYGVIISQDPREENGEALRMDYIVMGLTNTDFTEPSGLDVQTFQGMGVVRDAVLWKPTVEGESGMRKWSEENPQLDAWILFDTFDGRMFIPNAAFAKRSFNDMPIREAAA